MRIRFAWTKGLVAIAVALAMSSVASAGTITLSGQVDATYTIFGTLVPGEAFFKDGQTHIYRVGIFVRVSDLAPGESFGLVGYDMTLSGSGLQRYSGSGGGGAVVRPNYVGNNPITNLIISASGKTLTNWYTGGQNFDNGVSHADLIGMLTAIDPASLNGLEDDQGQPATDPRLAIGTGEAPTKIGAIFLVWNGQVPSQLNFNNVLGALADVPGKKFFNAVSLTAPPVLFVPEPSSIALLSLACVGFVFVARRCAAANRLAGSNFYLIK
jgi:hypothetical protein